MLEYGKFLKREDHINLRQTEKALGFMEMETSNQDLRN